MSHYAIRSSCLAKKKFFKKWRQRKQGRFPLVSVIDWSLIDSTPEQVANSPRRVQPFLQPTGPLFFRWQWQSTKRRCVCTMFLLVSLRKPWTLPPPGLPRACLARKGSFRRSLPHFPMNVIHETDASSAGGFSEGLCSCSAELMGAWPSDAVECRRKSKRFEHISFWLPRLTSKHALYSHVWGNKKSNYFFGCFLFFGKVLASV